MLKMKTTIIAAFCVLLFVGSALAADLTSYLPDNAGPYSRAKVATLSEYINSLPDYRRQQLEQNGVIDMALALYGDMAAGGSDGAIFGVYQFSDPSKIEGAKQDIITRILGLPGDVSVQPLPELSLGWCAVSGYTMSAGEEFMYTYFWKTGDLMFVTMSNTDQVAISLAEDSCSGSAPGAPQPTSPITAGGTDLRQYLPPMAGDYRLDDVSSFGETMDIMGGGAEGIGGMAMVGLSDGLVAKYTSSPGGELGATLAIFKFSEPGLLKTVEGY